MPVGLIGIVVCPGPAVPMSTEQNPVECLGMDTGYDIAGRNLRVVIEGDRAVLFHHGSPILSETLCDIIATLLCSLGSHNTRTEVALGLNVHHGTVLLKHGTGCQGYRIGPSPTPS